MASVDHIQRVFLGSDGPALHSAADWLLREQGGVALDLGGVLVVVPGGRAQRRLEELLAERSTGRALTPPTVVTLGGLMDRLMPADQQPVASGLTSLLAWAGVLREADETLLAQVVPHPPSRDDWPGWWSLAEQVMQAADELGAHLLMVQDVVDRSAHPGDAARWSALAELADRYEQQLAEHGQVDKHRARFNAIEAGTCSHTGPIVLVATADLQPMQIGALGCVGCPVHALIAAAESDAVGFDAMGGLIEAYWSEREIQIEEDAIDFCDRPGDQASAVLDAVSDWSEAQPTAADEITVGLGDRALDGPVARTLSLAGLPVRSAMGRPMAGARPVVLLRALAEFANGLKFDKLAALLRHPDVESVIAQRAGEATRNWLTLLDRYATDHLAARPTKGWLGDEAEAMDAVYRAALSLLPEPVGAQRPLNEWAEPISQVLAEVYGQRKLNRLSDDDRPVVSTLQHIGGTLRNFDEIDATAAPHCTFAQASTLLASQVSGQMIPDPGGAPAIELVGYLELLLDDAPRLVIAGLNEQHVPEAPRTSALLPEGVRRSVGMGDDTRRLSRDAYALTSMLAWRDGVRLIVGKRSQDGDPLLPSRLLLKTSDASLVGRVSRFVAEQDDTASTAPMLITPGDRDRFLIPRPVLPPEPITSLRVTAFRDYLACPYRFYLKHVLKIQSLDDHAKEVSAGGFGTLAHQALRVLAGDDLIGVEDIGTIADRLSGALDRAFDRSFGMDPPVAARIQAEQLRYRLSAFAPRHAEMVIDGWRIAHEETNQRATIQVDGEPFTIRGQIDRIDHHPELGWRLIDYKTSDTAKQPAKTHVKRIDGIQQRVDLQLPLYLDLSAGLGVDAQQAELAYINLPKKVSETKYEPAEWDADQLQQAREQRDFVIRQVRAGIFWPPNEPPSFDDGLAGVCGDEVADRAALIQASAGGGA